VVEIIQVEVDPAQVTAGAAGDQVEAASSSPIARNIDTGRGRSSIWPATACTGSKPNRR
jgi:hypothetical protein